MNRHIAALPPGHYVFASLPDGRVAVAPHDDPIAAVIRRLTAARVAARHDGWPGSPKDYAAVAEWLDEHEPPKPGQLALFGIPRPTTTGKAA